MEPNPLEDGGIFEKEFRDVLHGNEDYPDEAFVGEDLPAPLGRAITIDLTASDAQDVVEGSNVTSSAKDADFIDLTLAHEGLPGSSSESSESGINERVIEAENATLEHGFSGTTTPDDSILVSSNLDPQMSSRVKVEVLGNLMLTPRSCYEPFDAPGPVVSECEAVARLLHAAKQAGQDPDDFVQFELDDFAIYRNHALFPDEMCSLHHLDTKTRHDRLLFDGLLSVGRMRFFVKRVPILALPIGNYGTLKECTVRDNIWLRSCFNSDKEIYYRLRTPAKEYRRFFDPFTWVADLGKHFVDFLKNMGRHHRKVTIFHFRTTFSTWMKRHHAGLVPFERWQQQHPSEDFRTAVVANIGYLHKESVGVLGYQDAYFHTIWSETLDFKRYKPFVNHTENPPTVVTKYIYDCFQHLPFGDRLEAMPLSKVTQALRTEVIHSHNLELPSPIHERTKDISTAASQRIKDIKVGDTISTHRDGEGSGTRWRRDISHGFDDVDRWLALVQNIKTNRRGRRVFDVIWYYRACDTLCGLMKYPWNNELFLSDHCSCRESAKIEEDEVLGVHDVEFGGTSATKSEFFCRQTYVHAERKWITLRSAHLRCSHVQPASAAQESAPGDTLLVVLDAKTSRSQPCEFLTSYDESGKRIYRFRRLLRRRELEPSNKLIRPNELVYTEQLVEVRRWRIQEPCHVRFFRAGEVIPTPYDRDGVGGFFYITHQAVSSAGVTSYVPLTDSPPGLSQAFDPAIEVPKLRGLDLFCGGGNFGRGLEDGGGIEMKWANDYDSKAIHTYMANVSAPEEVSPFLGSIDDLQRLAISGKFSNAVPRIGEVDFISGGSPCPGFSTLTNDKTTVQQRKNQSLVAAFGSFIDLYRPKYGLLENVPGIVQRKTSRDQDVFSQLICAIVGLGYQTQFFFLDASSCGSAQRRARVFLAFAAPGYRLPRKPSQTHAHPSLTKCVALGNLPNGESMAERHMAMYTPFDFVSAAEATADLPPLYDAKPDICVPFPDHRISMGITKNLRTKISLIPTRPWGTNFALAWYGPDKRHPGSGALTAAERDFFPVDSGGRMSRTRANSNAYGRQFPNRLVETIVTRQSPSDTKNGRTLHWAENRVLTIMEARRAQGFRDEEVLLGLPADQYKIVGNSVAREVAVVLGVAFREAWADSLRGGKKGLVTGAASVDAALEEADAEKPLVVEDSDSDDDTGRDSSEGPSPTPATTVLSPTPPPRGTKRRLSRIVVEIPAPKVIKRRNGNSPGVGRSMIGNGSPAPSPLGKAAWGYR